MKSATYVIVDSTTSHSFQSPYEHLFGVLVCFFNAIQEENKIRRLGELRHPRIRLGKVETAVLSIVLIG